MPKISGVPKTRPFTDESGVLNTEGRIVFAEMESRITITGSGSPEGVVSAQVGATYIDIDGAENQLRYAKVRPAIDGDDSKGWKLG